MKWLAWDTSAHLISVVGMQDATEQVAECSLMGEVTFDVGFDYSERLLGIIHQVMKVARWEWEDLTFLGIGLGPGSFSGLRVGMTTARTVAHALKKPLVGVSSLAVWIRPIVLRLVQQETTRHYWVLMVRPACRGEIYALWGPVSELEHYISKMTPFQHVEECVGRWEEVMKRFHEAHGSAPWLVFGEAREEFLRHWQLDVEDCPVNRSLNSSWNYDKFGIQGRALGKMALDGWKNGLAREALQIVPEYLRVPDAELKRQAGQLL